MPYLVADTVEFLRELEFNNNREWFQANKKRYEESVQKPMTALAEVMIERMKEIDPQISITPKEALFRIYRDIRFSKDKSPYKTHAGMMITRTGRDGRTDHSSPGLYMHVGTVHFGVASGFYMIEPENVKAIRSFLAANPEELEQRLNDPPFKKLFKTVAGEKNKVLPPELKTAAERQPLIYNKQFYYWAEYDAEEAARGDLPEFLMEHMRAAQPMNGFLGRAFQ